ncbi:MAG: TrkH family potassium uptake protein [Halanaeroarchaeum sp.]
MSGSPRVDWRAALALVGRVLRYLSVPLVFPLVLGVVYGDGVVAFGATIVVTVGVGLALESLAGDGPPDIGVREGFLMVALTWIAVSAVGALPYVIAGAGTQSTLANPVNALFETMSGFTTTGATVMGDISVASHGRAIMLWRQLTQWLGGMGIVVLAVAILPELSVGGAQLMDAEAPGPGIQKLTPRIAETARALWTAYMGITALEVLALYGLHLAGLAPNMTLFNAVSHAFTTMATGGFSPEARSIEAFSALAQWVIVPFMVAAGTNFALFWHVMTGEPGRLWRDDEFRFFVGAMGVLSALTAALLFTDPGLLSHPDVGPIAGNLEASARHATFQVVSIVTTTGYASMNFNGFNEAAKFLLIFGMFVGGSAGSTGGAIKIVRWLVIVKAMRRELFVTVHPDAVKPIRLNGTPLDERAIRGIFAFTLLYLVTFVVATGLVLVDAERVHLTISVLEASSAVAATLGNVGPGIGIVGPMNNYLAFPATSKLLMVGLMWFGRLEILPVLVVLTRAYWRT